MRYRPPDRKIKKPVDTKSFVLRFFIRFFLVIFFLVGLILLFRYISYSKNLTISDIEISGSVYSDKDNIQKFTDKYLDNPILGIFSRRNIFLLSRYKLENIIKESFKGLRGVKVYIDEKKLKISIIEHNPNYLWCGDTPPLVWDEITSCFYVSEEGLVFSRAPFFSGDIYFKFYGPLGEGFSVLPIGSRIASITEFLRLIDFKNDLKNIGFVPDSIALSGLEVISINLWRGESREDNQISPKIIFNRDQDFDVLIKHLKAAIDQKEFKSMLDDKYEKLIYIDLRTDGKVFYKFLK